MELEGVEGVHGLHGQRPATSDRDLLSLAGAGGRGTTVGCGWFLAGSNKYAILAKRADTPDVFFDDAPGGTVQETSTMSYDALSAIRSKEDVFLKLRLNRDVTYLASWQAFSLTLYTAGSREAVVHCPKGKEEFVMPYIPSHIPFSHSILTFRLDLSTLGQRTEVEFTGGSPERPSCLRARVFYLRAVPTYCPTNACDQDNEEAPRADTHGASRRRQVTILRGRVAGGGQRRRR